jgi:hypothetical protein
MISLATRMPGVLMIVTSVLSIPITLAWLGDDAG